MILLSMSRLLVNVCSISDLGLLIGLLSVVVACLVSGYRVV